MAYRKGKAMSWTENKQYHDRQFLKSLNAHNLVKYNYHMLASLRAIQHIENKVELDYEDLRNIRSKDLYQEAQHYSRLIGRGKYVIGKKN